MKKLFSILTPVFVSLLFFIPNVVKADTINVSISPEYYDYDINGDYTAMKNYVNTYMSNNPSALYYVIYYVNSNSSPGYSDTSHILCKVYDTLPLNTYSIRTFDNNRINIFSSTRALNTFIKYPNSSVSASNDTNPFYNLNFYVNNGYLYYGLIDANFDFNINNSPNWSGEWVINNGEYTITSSGKLPFLVDFNPIPSDATPLLTQFFDITIEKLQLICDFITSSYIYLSIIVIFLIYFSILLLRRLK